MALKIYGVALSRAGRTLWMAEELGLPYEHVKTTFTSGTRTPEYLKINPNGHIPAIDEDGFTSGSRWRSTSIWRRSTAPAGSIRPGFKTRHALGSGASGV